jgi:hypothetical protein
MEIGWTVVVPALIVGWCLGIVTSSWVRAVFYPGYSGKAEHVLPPPIPQPHGAGPTIPQPTPERRGKAESVVTCQISEEWRIRIDGDRIWFQRLINGKMNESYRPASRAEAAVWASAVIQGFEPPRVLRHCDTPVG